MGSSINHENLRISHFPLIVKLDIQFVDFPSLTKARDALYGRPHTTFFLLHYFPNNNVKIVLYICFRINTLGLLLLSL